MNVQTGNTRTAFKQADAPEGESSHTVESLVLDTKVLADVVGEMIFTALEKRDNVVDNEMCERILTMQIILQERAERLLAAFRKSGSVS